MPTTERWNKMLQQPVDEERRALLRELLAERFAGPPFADSVGWAVDSNPGHAGDHAF